MQKLVFIGLLVFLCIGIGFSQNNINQQFEKNGEIYFQFEIASKKSIPQITKIVSIDNVKDNTVYAYANEKEFNSFLEVGLNYTILPHPNEGFDPPMASFEQIKNAKIWDFYPTYEAYVALMYQFEADYPGLCDVFSIGQSNDEREILVAKISDNVGTDENEPEFLYTSSIHGDELTGFPLMLNLIDSLLDNYGTVSRITNLVDNIEIYINPLANPDGTYAGGNSSVSGATRANAIGVDLNRNYPDPDDGPHPDGKAWQTETVHFMNFAESRNFVMSANFHGGAEVFNYPWDTWVHLAADDDWWQFVGNEWADTAQFYSPSGYMTDIDPSGITNGYDWYTITGGRQDYMNYFHQCREVTLEISSNKLISASLLDDHWEYNRRSLLNYLEQCLFGIRGVITDANTGLPIKAEVYIVGHEADSSWVYSSMPVGNYHRLLYEGTYDVQVSSTGYFSQTFQNVNVTNKSTTWLNVELVPGDLIADFNSNTTNISAGGSIDFTDLSYGSISSWEWIFEGAVPSTSSLQNPTGIVYDSNGSFDVTLIVSNGSDSDTLTKINFISVTSEYLMMNGSFTTCNGAFFDSGGEFGTYANNEDFEMTFFPSSPNGMVKVEFTSFDIEDHSTCNYDWLRVYDGPDSFATELGIYCSTNSPGTITSTHETGALTFVFHSDVSLTESGWEALVTCESDVLEVEITVLLEGPFNDTVMNTNLNSSDLIPLSQPYNSLPWNYLGNESVISIPNPDVVDWILVELRDAPNATSATSATIISQQAAFLLKDGSIVGLDGNSMLSFNNTITQSLFVVIWHRNHLGIMSNLPLVESDGSFSFDFSNASDQAYGTDSQKDLGSGIFGMFAGDANGDGVINANDATDLWYLETGESGYLGSDVNLNGQSNNQDKNDFWYINYSKTSKVPE